METITETERLKEPSKMSAKQLARQFTGKDLIVHCTEILSIRPTMLAGLLDVTERTLTNWADLAEAIPNQGKFDRLRTLYAIVCLAQEAGIKGRVILNLLNESIPDDQDQKSLLYYVVDEPNNKLVPAVASQVIASFK